MASGTDPTLIFTNVSLSGVNYEPLSTETTVTAAQSSLTIFEDIYKTKFFGQEHVNVMCTSKEGSYVVSVCKVFKEGKPYVYNALKTMPKGYENFELVVRSAGNIELDEAILKAVQRDDPNAYLLEDPAFIDEFVKIEESKHSQKRSALKLGLVYCKRGQKTAQEMFSNSGTDACSKIFWTFADSLGKKFQLDNSWTQYRGDMRAPAEIWYGKWNTKALGVIETVCHVAPLLSPEEHRRLLGNDIVMVYFLEEESEDKPSFNPENLDTFGEVPQVFIFVRPFNGKYRVGCLTKKNIYEFGPKIPKNAMTLQETKEWVLAKTYNGLCATNYCPPMNRLFSVPRRATIDSLAEKYPKGGKPPVSSANSDAVRPAGSGVGNAPVTAASTKVQAYRHEEGKGTVTFIDSEHYNAINSLVLMIASNIALIDEHSEIEKSAKEQLNFSVAPAIFADKSSEACAVVFSDDQKVIIACRGPVTSEPQRLGKYLSLKEKDKKVKLAFRKPNIGVKGLVPTFLYKILANIFPEIERYLSSSSFSYSASSSSSLSTSTPKKPIYLCGHCTGGSVAQLMAHVFAQYFSDSASPANSTNNPTGIVLAQRYQVKAVYTYGSLPAGNEEWKADYTELLGTRTYRVVQISDLIPSSIFPRELGWVHAGTLMSAGDTSSTAAQPHTVETYFNSLLPLHRQALEKLGAALSDRISAYSPSISASINKRETLLLSATSIEAFLLQQEQAGGDSTGDQLYTKNLSYSSPGKNTAVQLPPGVRTGGRVYTSPQLSSSHNYNQLSNSNSPIKKSSKVLPAGRGLINPDLTQQIRNNMFVLLDAFKVMRSYGLANATKVEFQQALGLTNKPLDNLDIIVLLLKNSPHPEVQLLERDIKAFLQEADLCLNLAASPSDPASVEANTRFDEKFAHMLTMAKTVVRGSKTV